MWAAGLAVAAAALACGRPVPPAEIPERLAALGQPNLVLIVVDTLRADFTTPYGFAADTSPELAAWAARGALFERVRSQSSWTKMSVASLMTSLWPRSHGIREPGDGLAESAHTLAEALREGGYATYGVQTNGWLHQSFGFHQGFDRYMFPMGGGDPRLGAAERGGRRHRGRLELTLQLDRYPHRAERVIGLHDRRAEDRHHRVAHVLVHAASVLEDDARDEAVVLVQEVGKDRGRHALGQRGESLQVRKQDCDVPLLEAEVGPAALAVARQDRLDHVRRMVPLQVGANDALLAEGRVEGLLLETNRDQVGDAAQEEQILAREGVGLEPAVEVDHAEDVLAVPERRAERAADVAHLDRGAREETRIVNRVRGQDADLSPDGLANDARRHAQLVVRQRRPVAVSQHLWTHLAGRVPQEQRTPLRRWVAIKVIRLGMATKEVLARFDAEKNALTFMNHPCIGRILDSGATSEGQPYFVMEYVDGTPLIKYCELENIPIDTRLRLFIDVCKGVQHAHTKGIAHHDLKPSNILVTREEGRAVPRSSTSVSPKHYFSH